MGDTLREGWKFGDFFTGKKRVKELEKKQPARPNGRDATGGQVANSELLMGLYRGSIVDMQGASPLAATPVNVPVSLVSIPTPVPVDGDERTKEVVAQIIEEKSEDFPINERTKLVVGTAWRWVRYDAKTMNFVWESIPDDSITDIMLDPISFAIKTMFTHDQFTVTIGMNQKVIIERIREISKDYINVKWVKKNEKVTNEDYTMRNPFGHMPIAFGHDCGENEHRGHSIFGRNLRIYKIIHDIEMQRAEILGTFNPKLVIGGLDSVEAFCKNNGFSDVNHIERTVFESKMYAAKSGETLDIKYMPSDATKPHAEALADLTKKVIMGGDIPEIFYGTLATGNEASVDSHKDIAIQCIRNLRKEDDNPYERLFNNTLDVLGFVNMEKYSRVKNSWGQFDLLSTEARAGVLLSVAGSIEKIMGSAGATPEMMLYFWKGFFPDMPDADIKKFVPGIKQTAKLSAMAKADLYGQRDQEAMDEEDADGEKTT